MNGFRLLDVTVNDGTQIKFKDDSIIILTGPNNCGKSQFLRDIYNIGQPRVILPSVNTEIVGNIDEALAEAMQSPVMKANHDTIYNSYNFMGRRSIFAVLQSLGSNFQLIPILTDQNP